MLPMGGTTANLAVDEELRTQVLGAEERSIRAIKVVVDAAKGKLVSQDSLPASSSFAKDFEGPGLLALLEDGVPCVVLFRLADEDGTIASAGPNNWLLFSWTPEDSNARQKMTYAASRKTLKDAFPSFRFKEMNATERGEVKLQEVLDQTRELTKEERQEAMSANEIAAERVKEEIQKEKEAAPKKLAGLVGLQIATQPSFEDAIEKLMADRGKAVVALLAGPKREELSGEVLEGVSQASQLKGRLPAEEPCYVILRPEADRILLLTWLPDCSAARVKMACSTFKKSVAELLKARAEGSKLVQAEVSEEADLTDDLGSAAAEAEPAPAEERAGAPKPGGFKPPAGGFALPGLGPPRG